jgi:hypothetical protein
MLQSGHDIRVRTRAALFEQTQTALGVCSPNFVQHAYCVRLRVIVASHFQHHIPYTPALLAAFVNMASNLL